MNKFSYIPVPCTTLIRKNETGIIKCKEKVIGKLLGQFAGLLEMEKG